MTEQQAEKKTKKKGPIRFEAILPVFIICGLTFLYFSYYFDRHLKKLFEYVGTQANGAEVNVRDLRVSFIKGSFDLDGLQVTDKEKPTLNALEIGNIHFDFLWDALLRMKFVVEDASINNIQLLSPRTSPGKVLPPEPAKPSKLNELQGQVMAQVKNKYGDNMLGDTMALLEGGDYKDQINVVREVLKSEQRVQAMVEDVETKQKFWDNKVKELSDTSKLKSIETKIQAIQKQKDLVKQAQEAKALGHDLKTIEKQYKEIEASTKQLKNEVEAITQYPNELQALVNEDIASLKNRFSIPKVDFKDMAMHLFAGQFAEYIAKARKYQALAKEYIPEKKEKEEAVIPRPRAEGKTYLFSVTSGYPLFWLKRAAISSTGTTATYSGDVSGELTNVTTDPKHVRKPVVLNLKGNFPGTQIMGVQAMVTIDHTKEVATQTAKIQVRSFPVSEKMFVERPDLKFGLTKANGSTIFNAQIVEGRINMNWNSTLKNPKFVVETKTKVAKEMLTNILSAIPVITIDGNAGGTFKELKLNITSNLGHELAQGFSRELSAKVEQAQAKLNQLVENKIKGPQKELMAKLGENRENLTNLNKLKDLYEKNKKQIDAEIKKLQSGGGKLKVEELKEKGKKLLKGIKF